LSTYYYSIPVGFGSKTTDFQAVLRAAGETETAQGNIRDWLQLDEGEALGFSFSQRK
jgi:hypothetical protein